MQQTCVLGARDPSSCKWSASSGFPGGRVQSSTRAHLQARLGQGPLPRSHMWLLSGLIFLRAGTQMLPAFLILWASPWSGSQPAIWLHQSQKMRTVSALRNGFLTLEPRLRAPSSALTSVTVVVPLHYIFCSEVFCLSGHWDPWWLGSLDSQVTAQGSVQSGPSISTVEWMDFLPSQMERQKSREGWGLLKAAQWVMAELVGIPVRSIDCENRALCTAPPLPPKHFSAATEQDRMWAWQCPLG